MADAPDTNPPVPQEPAKQEAPQQAGPATAVAERPAPALPDRKLDKLPPFKVLLHNDDENSMEHVVQTVVELTPLTIERSVQVMLEAHDSGVALLLVTHKERAELYCEQFRSKKLVVSMEEA
ncbi:MAG: ATP-dependent Clp protease adaptor ClpS [Phycisphaerales bacterium]